MKEQLKILIELQKLDTSIISSSKSIKEIPSKISSTEQPLKEAEAALKTQKQKLEAAEKKKRDKELKVEEINDKIEKMKARSNEIKDNKAYQAHLKEIEKAEQTRYTTEDEILDLMEGLDEESKKVSVAEAALNEEHRKVDEMKKILEAEVKEAEKELDALKRKRAGLVNSLEKDIYDRYMGLLTNLHGLAVTRVANEICTGCNMHIMPQLYVEIQSSDRIITCPQCNRILYYDQPSE